MKILELNGIWKLRKSSDHDWIDAHVPGSVLTEFLHAGKLEDPFFRDNEDKTFELTYEDFEYKRTFEISKDILTQEHILLHCDGLDTLATIYINDHLIANTDNMHRTYEFEIKSYLVEGFNHIRILFASASRFCSQKYQENPLFGIGDMCMNGYNHLRKAHSMFGWDWGSKIPDTGIFRDIRLLAYTGARLKDVYVTQTHGIDVVHLDIQVHTEIESMAPYTIEVTVTDPAQKTLTHQIPISTEESTLVSFDLFDPELWWPVGYGKQPLYHVEVRLKRPQQLIDSKVMNIGLRTLRIRQEKDQWGTSFEFEINGISIFAKGADYIIEDNLLGRYSKDKTEQLIKDCVDANFNCIRVWGGGIYPYDDFFDLCDQYGIVIWQDFMFACTLAYPNDRHFLENIKEELIDNIIRIRHHACLGLWCGNNEIEMIFEIFTNPTWMAHLGIPPMDEDFIKKLKTDYLAIFEDLIPSLLTEYDPNTFYWPSSPCSGGKFEKPNDENQGDVHYWEVWHMNKPFTDYRSHYFRFCSEFGFESFPSMKTINTFTLPEDRNAFSYIMDKHQKSAGGNGKILTYLSETYRCPTDFDSLIYTSQLLQAEAMRYGIEHFRRNRGRCMGAIYWQLNDCWPTASWSSIDYYGRWKALHYAAKRFYSPILVSALDDGTKVDLFVTNDTLIPIKGKIIWKLRDHHSTVLLQDTIPIAIDPLSAKNCISLDFSETVHKQNKRRIYLEYCLSLDGESISEGTVLFDKPKYFEFLDPQIQADIKEESEQFIIFIQTQAFAKAIQLDLCEADCKFSDNFFDLSAGEIKKITVKKATLSTSLSLETFKAQLTTRCLYTIDKP